MHILSAAQRNLVHSAVYAVMVAHLDLGTLTTAEETALDCTVNEAVCLC